jgi:hypothetical protein
MGFKQPIRISGANVSRYYASDITNIIDDTLLIPGDFK